MADAVGMDYVGYAAFSPDSSPYFIPLLPGSGFNRPAAITVEDVAANARFDPINWHIGLSTPSFTLRTRAHVNWCTPAHVNKWFGLTAAAADRPVNTGIISSAGKFQWKYGGLDAVEWDNCFVDRLQFSWRGVGSAIDVSLLVLPAGYHGTATDLSSTAPSTYGVPWEMQGINFGGSGRGVKGGSLTLMNRMTPDDSSDSQTAASDGRYYPNTYFPAHLMGLLSITQKSAATGVPSAEPSPSALGAATLIFKDAGATSRLTAVMQITDADYDQAIAFDIGQETKTYQLVSPASGTAMIALS